MKTLFSLIGGIAVLVMLLVAGAATYVWVTIPPEPDPDSLPSHVLAPPSRTYRDAVAEGRSISLSLLAEEKLPGLSLAVAVDGEIVWAEGFGWADPDDRTPVTPATLFRIGGVTETLTACAIGLLVERGRIDLDAPVQRYVPGFPEKTRPVSTRQLMTHTAGIRNHLGDREEFRKTGCTGDADRLVLFADDPLRFPPGTDRRYSAYGWVLVGAVVSGAADEPYLDFVQHEILAPLGMEHTVPDVAGGTAPGAARLFYPRLALAPGYGLQDAPEVDLSCVLPAAGFLSTPADLVRLGSAMMVDTLLDPETVKTLQTPLPAGNTNLAGQALGWVVRQVPMGREGVDTFVIGHGLDDPVRRGLLSAAIVDGQVPGGTATLLTVPQHRIAVAVATNVSGAENVPLLAMRLADLFVRRSGTR